MNGYLNLQERERFLVAIVSPKEFNCSKGGRPFGETFNCPIAESFLFIFCGILLSAALIRMWDEGIVPYAEYRHLHTIYLLEGAVGSWVSNKPVMIK